MYSLLQVSEKYQNEKAIMQNIIRKHLNTYANSDIEIIHKAYEFAQIAYHGEKRLSGEDWIEHPIRVTEKLADLKMDKESICAGILHDVLDFGASKKEVKEEFGKDVATLIEALDDIKDLTNRYGLKYINKEYADVLRKIVLAAGKDLRAISIRVVEKHDGVSSVLAHTKEQQEITLGKAFNIYAPIADLIGLEEYKTKIEDVAFQHHSPDKYGLYKKLLGENQATSLTSRQTLENKITELFSKNGIEYLDISSRTKAIYSLHKKIENKVIQNRLSFEDAYEQTYDKLGVRIILKNEADCYKGLDLIHANFEYLAHQFDDYISKPKSSGYQSIQSAIKVDDNNFAEIQLRTADMHEYNEYGPASHVLYKLGGPGAKPEKKKIDMIRKLLKWRENYTDNKSAANVVDIEENIFVFTPEADIIEITKGSTPVDFAYQIHTRIGDQTARAYVNGEQKPLSHILQSGDVVEIFTDKNRKHPSTDWLDFVKTKNARFHIRRNSKKSIDSL